MRKSKNISSSTTFFTTILKGIICGLTVFILILAVSSLIVLDTDIKSSFFFVLILINVGISSFAGASVTAICAKKSRLIISMFTVLILLSIIFLLLLCFNNASLSVRIYLIVPTSILSGFIGGVTGSNIRRK